MNRYPSTLWTVIMIVIAVLIPVIIGMFSPQIAGQYLDQMENTDGGFAKAKFFDNIVTLGYILSSILGLIVAVRWIVALVKYNPGFEKETDHR